MQSNLSLRHITNNDFILRNITENSLPWCMWICVSQALWSPRSIIPTSFSSQTVFAHMCPSWMQLQEMLSCPLFSGFLCVGMMRLVFHFRAFQEKFVIILQPFLGILSVPVSCYIEANTSMLFFPRDSFLNSPL